jgi:hypothetical protein
MITILSVLNSKEKKNTKTSENNLTLYSPCSKCKSRYHYNLECMYKNISK